MKRIFAAIITMCMLFSMLPTFNVTTFAAEEIIEISTLEQLEEFRKNVNDGDDHSGKTIRLTADIDMSKKYGADINGFEASWTPIGIPGVRYNDFLPFSGTFDGNGHKITGLYINSQDDYMGLFGYATKGAIKNLSVYGTVIGRSYVGGIVGRSGDNNEFLIDNCYSEVTVKGNTIGGIIGYSGKKTTVKNCCNAGEVTPITGGLGVGGIVGYNFGVVENCYNIGTVIERGEKNSLLPKLGGIAGTNEYNAQVKSCCNFGKVISDGDTSMYEKSPSYCHIGGIVGENGGSSIVENCYNKGEIIGNRKGGKADKSSDIFYKDSYSYVGGIVGALGIGAANTPPTVDKCYNIGNITGNGTNCKKRRNSWSYR